MLDGSKIDMSALPRDFLEAYPYPAFVLVAPIPPSIRDESGDEFAAPGDDHSNLPFTRSTHSRIQPFDAVESNEKWRNLTAGRGLLDCVTIKTARKVGDWISGVRAAKSKGKKTIPNVPSEPIKSAPRLPRDLTKSRFSFSDDPTEVHVALAQTSISPMTEEKEMIPAAPEGFWESENPPYEDRSARSDPTSYPDTSTGIEGMDGRNPGPETITIDLVGPVQVTLELTKTSMPLWQMGPAGSRTRMQTHTFLIITTVAKSPLVLPDPSQVGKQSDAYDPPSEIQLDDNTTPPGSALHIPRPPRKKILQNPTSPRNLSRTPLAATLEVPSESASSITPTDEIMALDLPAPALLPTKPAQPLFFNRDGTVSRKGGQRMVADAKGKSTDVHELLRTTDWGATPLGPMDQWPQSLKTIVSLVMQYPHQCCLWWGKELTLIYNAQYGETIHKHPHIFGMSGPRAWADIWSSIGPLSEVVLSGTPVYKEDDFLLFKQLPHQGTGTFEAYHSWMWVPVVQEDGSFGGLWNATIDTTQKVIAERRLAIVREMGERTSIARTMNEFDSAVIDIMSDNPRDVPFALLYHVDVAKDRSDLKSSTNATQDRGRAPGTQAHLRLAGSIGVPENHASAPSSLVVSLHGRMREGRVSAGGPFSHSVGITGSPTMSIVSSLSNPHASHASRSAMSEIGSDDDDSRVMDQWPLREALQRRRLVLIENCSALIQGFPIRVWDELPNAAIVVPIANDSDDGVPSAVCVIGLSIRRPFDDEYESFIHVLRLQLASGIAAVRSYEAERQRVDELAALDRAKSLLFSNVSHELRTPLTLVAGPLEDLLSESPEGPKRDMLIMARRNVRRLTRLVSTLMDVSRLEAGRLKGSFRAVNLGMMTRDLAALFRSAIERVQLKYVIEADLTPRQVFVDPDHYEKIIFNLIGNAMKYTMRGFVHVKLSYHQSEAVLAVSDSGVGIPNTDLNLVGERFHRVQSVSRSHEGTGIGLALVKELIKLHGGTLEINSATADESADGSHGSTFRVRLPLGSDHLPRDAIEIGSISHNTQTTYGQGIVDEAMQWNKDREGSSASSDSGGGESAPSSRGLDPSTLYFKKEDVIMLVDDSFDTRRYMRSIFAPYCTLVEARDGMEALELCQATLPDLIITDVMMPKMNGFGLLNAVKTATSSLKMVPIIMLTARGGEEAKVEGLLAGADDYLGKPFNARGLIARAHMQLQLGKKRRNLEAAFEERTSELRTLSEHAPGGIFRCAADGTVTFTNSAWHEISGYPSSDTVVNWGDYIMPANRRDAAAFWTKIGDVDSLSQTTEWQFTNGRWVTVTIIRLDKAAKGLSGILGCVTDITERKLNEESQRLRVIEAEQRRLEAEEAKRQQELLIDITSHEIRNPISSLMQCSSLVKTNLLSLLEQLEMVNEKKGSFVPTKQLITTINEDLEALESIYQCGLAQERISNDVLSLGRIQLDMLQMFDVEMDLRHEAHKTLSIFQNEARMKRITLSLTIGDSVDRIGVQHMKTDPVRLGQVVTNLLSNGIRFTSNSTIRRIELRFDLSCEPPADGSCVMPRMPGPLHSRDDMPIYLYVAVTDTGPGLTPKELDMLFQRFSQVSPKTHTIFGGSGLGLFVCRKITELMGGRIEVASEHGKGSTFRFFIKARTCQTAKRPAPGADRNTSSRRPALKKRNTGKATVGPKPHVLVVEDNLINQTVLMRQLKHVGLTCEVASNGLEALEKIRKVAKTDGSATGQMFDCVLMDLEMPVMDGLTALSHIRKEEAEGKLALNLVIALTGNARQGQIDQARAAGMDEVVIKPYRLDDLLQKIEDMMRIRAEKASSQMSMRSTISREE